MANDERGVVAPNATIISEVPKDPPTEQVEWSFPRPGGSGYAVVRDGYTLEDIPARQEGLPTHRFHSIKSLARYLTRNLFEHAGRADIIVETKQIYVYVDPASEEPQTLTCSLDLTPEAEGWDGLLQAESVSQKRILQHLRAWKETVVEADGLLQALGTISVVGNTRMTSSVDETGATRLVSGEESKDISVKIPPAIVVDIPIFEGVFEVVDPVIEPDEVPQAYAFDVLISVDTHAPVSFSFDAPKIEAIKRAARMDAAEYLQSLLGEAWLVSVGGAGHRTRSAVSES